MRDLSFEGRLQDFSCDARVPVADTVLLLDVLYQLPTEVQDRLLDAAAHAARRRLLIRAADPSRGWRAGLTRVLERGARRVWPHAGATVNARPIAALADPLQARGFAVRVVPCLAGTPFSNVLVVAERG